MALNGMLRRLLPKAKGVGEAHPYGRVPNHIAIIPDGNGRWATGRGLPRTAGYRVGAENIRRVIGRCCEIGIKYVSFYVFSTENWARPKEETDELMRLLRQMLRNIEAEMEGYDASLRIIGDTSALGADMVAEMGRAQEVTKGDKATSVIFAVNYGGRREIADALKRVLEGYESARIRGEDEAARFIEGFGEGDVPRYLYTHGIPDPDLLIRTSGEQRLSNFLLWQSAYSELWFCPALWPDFGEGHLDEAIKAYAGRERRYGGAI